MYVINSSAVNQVDLQALWFLFNLKKKKIGLTGTVVLINVI